MILDAQQRSPFSPPPAPLDEQPDPVRLRVEQAADPEAQQQIRVAHSRIRLAAVAGLLAPVSGLVLLLAPGATWVPAGWMLAWCMAMVLGASAATSAMALPRRPDLIGLRGVADDGRFRPARGATAGIVAAALMACGLSLALPVDLAAVDESLAVSAIPWFGVLAALSLAVTLMAAFGMRAGRLLATLAARASVSFSAPLPAAPDPASAEQRRRAVARASETALANMESERHLRSISCIMLSAAGAVALVAGVLQVVVVVAAAQLTLGALLVLASTALLVGAAAIAGNTWRLESTLGVHPALAAGMLAVGLALSIAGQMLGGHPTILAPAIMSAALFTCVLVAGWHHTLRRYADTAPSFPVLIDALYTADDAIRQPAHRLLMALARTDLPDEPDDWRKWQARQADAAAADAPAAATP